MAEPIALERQLLVKAPDGHTYKIRPGQNRKGLSIALHDLAPTAKRAKAGSTGKRPGRQPHPVTLELRDRLEADAAKKQVQKPAQYVQWYLKRRPDATEGSVRQIVYRERAAVLAEHPGAEAPAPAKAKKAKKTAGKRAKRAKPTEGGGPRGRPPHPATQELRGRLAKDAAQGKLLSAPEYLEWYLKKRPDANPASARNTVYKERREFAGKKRAGKRAQKDKGVSPALGPVRKAIAKDAPEFRDTRQYVRIALDADKRIGQKPARQMVYRELRAAKKAS